MTSIKRNFSYQIIYQAVTIALPAILMPYVSRVLGVEGLGINSYTYSVVQYFMLFCMLGLTNYGNREIAKARDDSEKCSKTFWEIYTMQVASSSISMMLYFLYIRFVMPAEYRFISCISSLYLFSALMDISWFFYGMEQFKTTTLCSSIVRVMSTIAVFLFVKTKEDVWVYVLIYALAAVIQPIVLWTQTRKYLFFVKPEFKNVLRHIKPNLILFLPVLAISMYHVMDKIMLSMISNVSETGAYDAAYRVVELPLAISGALGTVMLPRISAMVASGDDHSANSYVRDSIQFVVISGCAMCFGIMAVAHRFIPIYYGSEFENSIILLIIMSPLVLLEPWMAVFRTQCLIPRGMDRSYVISVFLGAFLNLVTNALLIPLMGAMGAAIATLLSDFVVCFYQTYAVRKLLPIRTYFKDNYPFVIFGMSMLTVLFVCFDAIVPNTIPGLILVVFLGAVVYCMLSYWGYRKINKKRFIYLTSVLLKY